MIKAKTGVVLINLGTPVGKDISSVRRYLKEFLDDPRVIDLPWWLRKPLLYLFILPFRPKQSAKAYQEIWDPNLGSPLLFHTQALAKEVQKLLGVQYQVAVGMRYAKPTIEGAIQSLLNEGCDKLIFLPLFPQYSSAATGSAIQNALQSLATLQHIPACRVHHDFYNDPRYIQAQSERMAPYLQHADYDKILFSYHSLPVRHIRNSNDCLNTCRLPGPCAAISTANRDCYRAKCYETSRLIAQNLGLSAQQYEVVFQSRLGRTEWIGPDLTTVLNKLIHSKAQNIMIASPSFVTDCLETLEEIGIRAKKQWQLLGGKQFTLVPCLNTQPSWVKAIASFITDK